MYSSDAFVDKIVLEAINNLKDKFAILWPSSKITPPTESNLVNALSEALNLNGYYTFTEVPYRNGRIDLLAIDKKTKHTLIIAELKSEKLNYKKEMYKDYERLDKFTIKGLFFPDQLNEISEIFMLQAIWSERTERIEYYKKLVNTNESPKDDFERIVCSSTLKKLKRIDVNKKETLSVLYFGRSLKRSLL